MTRSKLLEAPERVECAGLRSRPMHNSVDRQCPARQFPASDGLMVVAFRRVGVRKAPNSGVTQIITPGLTSADVADQTRKGLVNRTRSSARADYAAIASRHLFTLFN